MHATPLTRRTIGLALAWLVLVTVVTIVGSLVADESVGERLVLIALWPLLSITYGLSRVVDLVGGGGAAEPASSNLSSSEVGIVIVIALVLYLVLIVAVANLTARLTLRRRHDS